MNGFQTYDQWKTASPHDDAISDGAEPEAISNIQDLAKSLECSVDTISKQLFKSTECGIAFNQTEGGVSICGYAEGADAECIPIELRYPFSPEAFSLAVQQADAEGVELWHEWNN